VPEKAAQVQAWALPEQRETGSLAEEWLAEETRSALK